MLKYKNIIKDIVKTNSSLHDPYFDNEEKKKLSKCIESNYVSYLGSYVNQFEKELSKFTKSKYVVATNSGTSGLHISLMLAKVNSGDEVIIPSLSFVAVANSVLYINACPIFADIEENTLGLCPYKLESWLKNNTKIYSNNCININTNKIIRALIVVHVFGNPCKINELIRICRKFKIKLIEDAAESLGSFVGQKHTGTLGNYGVLSFNGNKIITTGGGGAILLKSKRDYLLAKHITTTAKSNSFFFIHDRIGFNYRMPNINAALGCSQLQKISKILKLKKRLHEKYQRYFCKYDGITLLKTTKNNKSNYWLNSIILTKINETEFMRLIKDLKNLNLSVRPIWEPLHKLSYLKHYQKHNLDVTEKISKKVISLPSGPMVKI